MLVVVLAASLVTAVTAIEKEAKFRKHPNFKYKTTVLNTQAQIFLSCPSLDEHFLRYLYYVSTLFQIQCCSWQGKKRRAYSKGFPHMTVLVYYWQKWNHE